MEQKLERFMGEFGSKSFVCMFKLRGFVFLLVEHLLVLYQVDYNSCGFVCINST